tara:strand:+ start:182 stop:622 length:441 start_codon:yes stop_codon:yes gene_type:complete
MTEIELTIGGRTFIIACEGDEQEKVKRAADLIDSEAKEIQSQLGRIPEGKMLLLSALMIADRVLDQEEDLLETKRNLANLEISLTNYKENEGESSNQKIENLKMEGLIEKMLTTLESFLSNKSEANEETDKKFKIENSDKSQPKLF